MENAFTPCPVCSPARASFHTGRIPSAHGIHDHIGEQNVGAGHPGIAGQTSLAEVLQGQGYQTGLVGKWHLNHFREPPPGWDDVVLQRDRDQRALRLTAVLRGQPPG